jgi:hypothetical protein
VVAAADELVGATARLNAALDRKAADDPRAANDVLRRLARILLPLVFTTEGRYTHEAADITPMMSTHRASMYPGLNRAFAVAELEDANERGFLVTKLVRQGNRFRDEMRRAEELADAYAS